MLYMLEVKDGQIGKDFKIFDAFDIEPFEVNGLQLNDSLDPR